MITLRPCRRGPVANGLIRMVGTVGKGPHDGDGLGNTIKFRAGGNDFGNGKLSSKLDSRFPPEIQSVPIYIEKF